MGLFDFWRRPLAPPSPVGADSAASRLSAARLENNLRNTFADPSRANFWKARRTYNDLECEELGRNGLARRALTMRPFDATREGWSVAFSGLDPDEAVKVNARLRAQQKRLDAQAKLRLAGMRAEQYGHSIVVIGVDDGAASLELPLVPESVRKVLWLRVYWRPEYTLGPLSEATSENFGYPEWYEISDFWRPEISAFDTAQRSSGVKRVHHSRILGPFHTEDGHSRLDEIGEALEDFFATQTSASKLVDTFSIGILKIQGWLGRLAQNSEAASGRIAVAQRALSMIGSLVLDRDSEDFSYENRSAGGISDLVSDKGMLLTAFTGHPSMTLLGAEPRGFSTGAEIVDHYYSTVKADQADKLEAPVRKLIDLLLRSEDGPKIQAPPDSWSVKFHPLRAPAAAELAEIRSKIWGAAAQLAEKGLITRDEFRSAISDSEAVPSISLSVEGSQQEASALAVGQMQALVSLLLAAYPEGPPPESLRAALEGALPMIKDLALRIFPDPPEPLEDEITGATMLTPEEERASKFLTAEEIAASFGSVTAAQLKRKRAPMPRQIVPGLLTWVKPGAKPLYRLSEVEELIGVAGPDLASGTADDPQSPPAV